MQLKNLATEVVLLLPDDLLWSDEHSWSPATASVSYLITGALLVQSAVKLAGRPMTLAGAQDMAWITRSCVQTLYDWAVVPLGESTGRFELSLFDGRVFTVAFRHAEVPIEAEPVAGFTARSNSDFYRITLKLMQI